MADRWEELESAVRTAASARCAKRGRMWSSATAADGGDPVRRRGSGAHEDEQGAPFVGKAGQLLDDMLAIIGLDRTMVYIANIVKCRPPQNRDPLGVEQDACIGYLREQVTLLSPEAIVCLGRIAAMRLIREDFQDHARAWAVGEKGGFELMAMFTPRRCCAIPRRRPDAFEDLMSLREKGPRGVRAHAAAGKAVRMRRKKRGVSRLAFVSSFDRSGRPWPAERPPAGCRKMPMPSRTVSTSW